MMPFIRESDPLAAFLRVSTASASRHYAHIGCRTDKSTSAVAALRAVCFEKSPSLILIFARTINQDH
jgi:hypothetical protein